MKNTKVAVFTVLLSLTVACARAPQDNPPPTIDGPGVGDPLQRRSDLTFDIHDPKWGCGQDAGSVFSCLQQACAHAGGTWDAAGFQCLCDDGVIFVQGSRSECQRAHDGKLMPGAWLMISQSGSMELRPVSMSRTPNVSRLGGTSISLAPEFRSGAYLGPQAFERIVNREHEGYDSDRPHEGIFWFHRLDLVVESYDEIESAMVRSSFAEREQAQVSLGVFEEHLGFIGSALASYSRLRELPRPEVLFASQSGGCATGCRLAFQLPAPEGYRVRLIRDYFWGSIGFEAVELLPLQGDGEGAVQAVLFPSGKVSHLQGKYVLSARGQVLGGLRRLDP